MKGAMTLFSARTRRRPTRTSRNTMGMSQYFLRYLRNCQSCERTSLFLITRSSRNGAGRDFAPGKATTSKVARARAASARRARRGAGRNRAVGEGPPQRGWRGPAPPQLVAPEEAQDETERREHEKKSKKQEDRRVDAAEKASEGEIGRAHV